MYERTDAQPIGERIASSRVAMLIAIYEAAIDATKKTERMLRSKDNHEAALAKSQAMVLVGLIENGLDLSQGDIPKKIQELCRFVEQSLLNSKPDEIAAATRVLQNLRDGFIGIKSEAIALEDIGTIPHLPTNSIDTIV